MTDDDQITLEEAVLRELTTPRQISRWPEPVAEDFTRKIPLPPGVEEVRFVRRDS